MVGVFFLILCFFLRKKKFGYNYLWIFYVIFFIMRNTKEKILSILMLLALMANNLLYPINYVAAQDSGDVEIIETSIEGENLDVELDVPVSDDILELENPDNVLEENWNDVILSWDNEELTWNDSILSWNNEELTWNDSVLSWDNWEPTRDDTVLNWNESSLTPSAEDFTWNIEESIWGDETWKSLDELERIRETLNDTEISGQETYKKITVNVKSPAGTFPEGTELRISPITTRKEIKEIKEQLVDSQENIVEEPELVAFDISFIYILSDWTEVELQPKDGESVQVTFDYSNNKTFKKAEADDSQTIEVYHINDKDENWEKVEKWEETVEKIEINQTASEEIDSALVIDAENFSIYVLTLSEDNTITLTLNPWVWEIVAREDIEINDWIGIITSTDGDVVLPWATNTWYVFNGWHTTSWDYIWTSWDSYHITGNTTLYGKWKLPWTVWYFRAFDGSGTSLFGMKFDKLAITWFTRNTALGLSEVLAKDWVTEIDSTGGNYVSGYPIYGWVENNTFYWWSEADTVYFHPDTTKAFKGMSWVKIIDLTWTSTELVENFAYWFDNNRSLTTIKWKINTNGVKMFDDSGVTYLEDNEHNSPTNQWMSFMFNDCKKLTTVDLSEFNTTNVIDMKRMFAGCEAMTSIDVSNFDTHNVKTFYWMFRKMLKIQELDLSNFDTSSGISMAGMFTANTLKTLTLWENWDTSNVEIMSNMFYNCTNLETIYADIDFDTTSVTNSNNMFKSCTKLVWWRWLNNETPFNSSKINASYAKVASDSPAQMWYFTSINTSSDEYTIIFENRNWDILWSGKVANGEIPTYSWSTPLRSSTQQVVYTFDGWYPELSPATMNTTYTAIYRESPRLYTVTLTWTPAWYGTLTPGSLSKEYGAAIVISWDKLTVGWTEVILSWNEWYEFQEWTGTCGKVEKQVCDEHIIYSHSDPIEFTWGNNLIITNPWYDLFSESNYQKDFEISFDIVNQDLNNSESQATILNVKDEDQNNVWPGIAIRKSSSAGKIEITATSNYWKGYKTSKNYSLENLHSIKISRINSILYVSINWSENEQLYDYSGFNAYFTKPIVFGSSYKDEDHLLRPAKITLSNILIKSIDTCYNWNVYAVTWDCQMTAKFSASDEYPVTIESNNAEYGTVSSGIVRKPYWTTITVNGNTLNIWWTIVTATTWTAPEWHTYTFSGWTFSSECESGWSYKVLLGCEVTANFSSSVNNYTITWNYKDANGEDVIYTWSFTYWEIPSHSVPSYYETEQTWYTFSGWTPELTGVTWPATYFAVYTETPRKYKVSFAISPTWYWILNPSQIIAEYGSQIITEWNTLTVWNETVTATVTWADEQYTYVFVEWTGNCGNTLTHACTITAIFDKILNNYEITWIYMDWNWESVTEIWVLPYWSMPNHDNPPYYETNATWYTFSWWNPDLTWVVWEQTYTAIYNGLARKYNLTVTSADIIRWTVSPTSWLFDYGSTVTLTATAKTGYSFSRWIKVESWVETEISNQSPYEITITWNTEIKAEFGYGQTTYKVKHYKQNVNWNDYESPEIEILYGITNNTTTATAKSYTWFRDPGNIEQKTILADGSTEVEIYYYRDSYNVYWNYMVDGSEGSQEGQSMTSEENYLYGQIPEYKNISGYKTVSKVYTFNWWYDGWYHTYFVWENLPEVTWQVIYTAQYTEVPRPYEITWLNDDDSVIDTTMVAYGVVPTHASWTKAATDEWTYTFAWWTPIPAAVTWDATYKATFTAEKNSYTITLTVDPNGWWALNPGSVYAEYGTLISTNWNTVTIWEETYTANPTIADAQYTYTFSGWINNCGDMVRWVCTITAEFIRTVNSYTVIVVSNNTNSWTVTTWSFTVPYGTAISTSSNVLTVGTGTTTANSTPSNDQYTYTFVNWTDDCGGNTVTKACTIIANFESTVNDHTVNIASSDTHSGTVTTWSITVPYGTAISTNENVLTIGGNTITATPTTNDAQYTYTFVRWNSTCGDEVVIWCNITAEFTSVVNNYTVTIVSSDTHSGTVTTWSITVPYGISINTWSNVVTIWTETSTANPNEQTQQWNFSFANWTNACGVEVIDNCTITANFNSTLRSYTIQFVSNNNEYGTVTSNSMTTNYWAPVNVDDANRTVTVYGTITANPTPSDDQYTYTFLNWINSCGNELTDNCTITWNFTRTTNEYTITWKDWNGAILKTEQVAYGEIPAYVWATPAKAEDDQYIYTFNNTWSPEIGSVTWPATYTAQFNTTLKNYTVTLTVTPAGYGILNPGSIFADYGTPISINWATVTIWTTGYTATASGADAQYTYAFSGWNNTCGETVTHQCTIIAQFTRTVNNYTVTFYDEDETTVLDSQTLPYWSTPTYGGAAPTKSQDAQYTYTFGWWSPAIQTVEWNQTYTATYTPTLRSYTITWLDDDDSVIDTTTVNYGVVPTHADPTKAVDAQYTYTFDWWTPTVVSVTWPAAYKATYSTTTNEYTITWNYRDANWGRVEYTGDVAYGQTPSAPTLPATSQSQSTVYTFTSWDPAVALITWPATYTAQYLQSPKPYTITWKNDDWTTIDTTTVNYGIVPTHASWTKAADAQYTYTFAWWSPTPTAVAWDATYTATFNSTVNEYTITWKDGNGSILKTEQVAYGEIPAYVWDTPTKDADNTYTYTFNNTWSPTIVSVTEDATYIAQFTPNYIDYTVTWKDYDWTELSWATYHYNDDLVVLADPTRAPDETYTYRFNSWTPAPSEKVTESKVYTATYDEHYIDYTITFVNWDNQIICSNTYHYWDTVIEPVNPTRPADEQYIYTFAWWSPSVTTVLWDKTYMAQYDSTVNGYEITWNYRDTNGARVEFTSNELYWSNPALPTLPELSQTQSTVYTFVGWDSEIVVVEWVKTYTAQYNEAPRQYTIIWKNDDGTIIDTTIVNYGVVPTHADPSKAATTQYIYTFVGWNPELVAVTWNAEYTAVFQETSIKTNWGESGIRKDNCPNWDFSDSYYDGICWKENTHWSAWEKDELQEAYERAYGNGITTMDTLDKADPDWYLLRGHMAKMAVNFMVNSLWYDMPDDIPEHCLSFNDDPSIWESDEIKYYAERACALWIMWIDMINNKFLPNDIVSRAEFGTIASRIIWWSRYNVRNTAQHPYYERHLNELKREKIMTKVENPLSWDELRKWVWLVFKRISEKK